MLSGTGRDDCPRWRDPKTAIWPLRCTVKNSRTKPEVYHRRWERWEQKPTMLPHCQLGSFCSSTKVDFPQQRPFCWNHHRALAFYQKAALVDFQTICSSAKLSYLAGRNGWTSWTQSLGFLSFCWLYWGLSLEQVCWHLCCWEWNGSLDSLMAWILVCPSLNSVHESIPWPCLWRSWIDLCWSLIWIPLPHSISLARSFGWGLLWKNGLSCLHHHPLSQPDTDKYEYIRTVKSLPQYLVETRSESPLSWNSWFEARSSLILVRLQREHSSLARWLLWEILQRQLCFLLCKSLLQSLFVRERRRWTTLEFFLVLIFKVYGLDITDLFTHFIGRVYFVLIRGKRLQAAAAWYCDALLRSVFCAQSIFKLFLSVLAILLLLIIIIIGQLVIVFTAGHFGGLDRKGSGGISGHFGRLDGGCLGGDHRWHLDQRLQIVGISWYNVACSGCRGTLCFAWNSGWWIFLEHGLTIGIGGEHHHRVVHRCDKVIVTKHCPRCRLQM